MLVGGSSRLLACPVCFGGAEGSLIDGAKLGVLALVGVTLVVQGSFVAFFIYLRKRAKRMADVDLETEWLELQRGSRPS
jgi:predicted transporter